MRKGGEEGKEGRAREREKAEAPTRLVSGYATVRSTAAGGVLIPLSSYACIEPVCGCAIESVTHDSTTPRLPLSK